jgi:hypothetical protein
MKVEQLANQFKNLIKERDNCQYDSPEWDYFNDCANGIISLVESQDMALFRKLINQGW